MTQQHEATACPHRCPIVCRYRVYVRINDPQNHRSDSWGCTECPCLYEAEEGTQAISTGTPLTPETLREEARQQVIDAIAGKFEDLGDGIGTLTNVGMNNMPDAHEQVADYVAGGLEAIRSGGISPT